MSLNAALRLTAGSFILISLILGYFLTPYWYYLTGFVGLNLLQSGFTRWCPAISLFRRLGLKEETCGGRPSVQQGVHLIAGLLVLTTVAPVLFMQASQNWLLLTAVIGASLGQSAFSGWCPAMTFARLLGCKPAQ
ncbi:YgaP family membrane protein [Marinobacterium arenosum]|uniref:YgaP family membrane protein n=1 Tax=Marinobacterium arenosum TaxID=2862496 RepID=UPI001C9772CD|nr:DUF2892 domain-containing protein [Marinobacterium arenosum]MBY4677788.1 DUF2892 domain-containing protein [Marinobacterium arenosum]